jgi:PhnB protein
MTEDNVKGVTAYLCARDAATAIEFYKRAFGAEEPGDRIMNENGTVGHAEIKIGQTMLMIADEYPEQRVFSPLTLKGNSVTFTIQVDDADGSFERAVSAGATIQRPLKDELYGRAGWVVDPFGHVWNIYTPNERESER